MIASSQVGLVKELLVWLILWQYFGKNQILAIHHRKVNFCFLRIAWGLGGGSQCNLRGCWLWVLMGGVVKNFTWKKTPSEAKSIYIFFWVPKNSFYSQHLRHQMYVGFFFPTPTNSPTIWMPTGRTTIKFSSDTSYLEVVSHRGKGWVPQGIRLRGVCLI